MAQKNDFFDGDYAVNQTKFEMEAVIRQAAWGTITSKEALDQIEDLIVCLIIQGLDDVFKNLYETDPDMLKHIMAKLGEAMTHRSGHIETYFCDTDLEVK